MANTLDHLMGFAPAVQAHAAPSSLLDEIIATTEAQPVAKPKAKPAVFKDPGSFLDAWGGPWWEPSQGPPLRTAHPYLDEQTGRQYPTRAAYERAMAERQGRVETYRGVPVQAMTRSELVEYCVYCQETGRPYPEVPCPICQGQSPFCPMRRR